MKIEHIADFLKLMFIRCIIANENSSGILTYQFSDPDGERSGKSGWSFGVCQFDISNNPNAVIALKEMNFSNDEIVRLQRQTIEDMTPMNSKLLAGKDVVDKWDARQIKECLNTSLGICKEVDVELSSEEVLLHLADYHNQFFISKGGKMYRWLAGMKGQSREVKPEDVRDFKLSLPWGQKRPDDVIRRYENIAKIYKNGHLS